MLEAVSLKCVHFDSGRSGKTHENPERPNGPIGSRAETMTSRGSGWCTVKRRK